MPNDLKAKTNISYSFNMVTANYFIRVEKSMGSESLILLYALLENQ